MVIDESIIENGIDARLLSKLINRHAQYQERYEKLSEYYRGRHAILNRQRTSKGIANNRIVCNHAKYITDITTAYLVGNPVTYSVSDGYDIDSVIDEYCNQDMPIIDSTLTKDVSIYGRAYELIYADEDGHPRSVRLSPMQAFVVYAATAQEKPLFGVYYYKTYDVDGMCTGVVCSVYTDSEIMTFASRNADWLTMECTEEIRHYFGGVPIIEYRNNEECQGDFEQLIPLIDAYNLLQSDRVNDKEQFVDAFLFLTGIDIDSEQAKKLREERILMGYEGSKAEYLSKIMEENDIEVLRTALKNDIHTFSTVPDMTDEQFAGNLSGVAIKYKLMGFEQSIRNKERYIAKSMKQRFKLYVNFLSLKGVMGNVPLSRVEITFTRNLPANDLETAQMINNLTGIASSETLLAQLSFVTDAKEENELIAKENAENERKRDEAIEQFAKRGY